MKRLTVAGKSLGLLLPVSDRERLYGTCFRGQSVREAGNFHRWPSFDKMLADVDFMSIFRDILEASVEEHDEEIESGKNYTESITVPFYESVGWTSSLPRFLLNGAKLVPRRINDRFRSMFVVLDDVRHPAPVTNLVSTTITIGSDFKRKTDLVGIIRTIYPGPHIGVTRGDLTKERGFVLFDFHHPGGDSFVELEL